jgi:hypothetical protein
VRNRGTEFDVEEGPPSWWHWTIYPGAGPDVIGERSTGRRRPLSPPALKKSITGLREAATRGKGIQRVNDIHSAWWRLVRSRPPTEAALLPSDPSFVIH